MCIITITQLAALQVE